MITIEIKNTDKFKSKVTVDDVMKDLRRVGSKYASKAQKVFKSGYDKAAKIVMSEAKKVAISRLTYEINMIEKGIKKAQKGLEKKKSLLSKLIAKK